MATRATIRDAFACPSLEATGAGAAPIEHLARARDARDIRTLIEEGRADPSVAPGRWTPTRWNPPGEAPRRDDRKTFDILSRRARTFIDRAETADTVLDHDVAKRVELVFGAVARTARNLVTFRGDPPVAPETLSGIALDAARTRGWA